MKTFKLLPLLAALSASAFAETVPVPEASSVSQNVTAIQAAAAPEMPVVLPQLSFEAQQARATQIAQQAENVIQQEEKRRVEEKKQAEAQAKVKQTIGNNSLMLTAATSKIYQDNGFQPMWQDKGAVKTFLKEYAAFAASGVSSKSARALQQIINTPDGLARDMLLTDSFLDYLYYNKGVAKNADQWLYRLGSYSPSAPSQSVISSWVSAVKNGKSSQFVSNLVPRNHIYQETVAKLFAMSPNGVAASSSKKAASTKSKKGKKSAESEPVATGGSATFAKLALNAQRLRIIPSFNNGIFVNIPSYQLYYIRNGQQVLQSRVAVGREDRQTPVMVSRLSNVVVNPPWTIPPTILSKDTIPKLARDPGYADRAGYEIFDRSGNKVNPRSVNWSSYVNSKNIPYMIRQKAGDNAALGRYKFNMPSSNAIYLHDTPNHGIFSKAHRAMSSGCVRVDKSDDLASILLKEAGWSMDRKRSVLASKKTTSANISSDNPVYLYYVTAWVEGGKVHTLPDIYKWDSRIQKTNLNWNAVKNAI